MLYNKLNKTFFLILSAVTMAAFVACGDDDNDYNLGGNSVKNDSKANDNGNGYQPTISDQEAVKRLEFPKTKSDDGSIVIVHRALLNSKTGERGINYCVEWNPTKHASRWTCYQMYGKSVNGVTTGTNGEYTDRYYPSGDYTSLAINSQYPNDTCVSESLRNKVWFTVDPYRSSGYDHGHMCPSADRLGSYEANFQTFFMTNMQPQVNSHNSGIWAAMESKVRKWAEKNFDTLYVVKGGTIDRDDLIKGYIGSGANKIPVPKYFFMALMGKNPSGHTALGFWIEHNGNISKTSPLKNYVVNIKRLEELTGIDFFCNLPDGEEQTIENLNETQMLLQWPI